MDGFLVTLNVSKNVLEDNNGIIHDETRRERQTGQRQRV